jgi:DNA-binding response OmpR family regulator
MPFLEQVIRDNAAYGDLYSVKFVIAKALPNARVFADKDRLNQVLANLLSNAAKFSSAGDVVEISVAKHHDNSLRISVTDFGAGIPEAFQPKLFERFTQSDSSDSRSKGGTGLGLSITKVIVEKHGGNIGFISREGIGSTFYIELPELMGEMETDTEQVPRQLSCKHSACILIVEDDPDIAMLLKRMLAEAGYNSEIAYDAEQARQKLKANPAQFKAITLDLILPGENGLSLLDYLRRETATHDIPVVVVSVTADEIYRSLVGGAIGVVDWLQKPIDQKRLINAVKQAAGANRLPRVLHVEDENDVHKVVSMILREHCVLTWTTTLSASKEALLTENFDLVLLDINLPDGSGLDLLEIIENRITPPRVVIFSAHEVTDEYAKKVNKVLVKSKTNMLHLANVIKNIINHE